MLLKENIFPMYATVLLIWDYAFFKNAFLPCFSAAPPYMLVVRNAEGTTGRYIDYLSVLQVLWIINVDGRSAQQQTNKRRSKKKKIALWTHRPECCHGRVWIQWMGPCGNKTRRWSHSSSAIQILNKIFNRTVWRYIVVNTIYFTHTCVKNHWDWW